VSEQSKQLKRLLDAAKGRPLSWSLAQDVEQVTGVQHSGGDKLCASERAKVQAVCDEMIARGIRPARSLATPMQRQAARRKQAR
jgi:hypothetical protein